VTDGDAGAGRAETDWSIMDCTSERVRDGRERPEEAWATTTG